MDEPGLLTTPFQSLNRVVPAGLRNGVESRGEMLDAPTALPKSSGRFPAMNRKTLHILLGLVLVACLVCPYVEFAIGWNDTIFTTGCDTESSVAVVMLLVGLVLALAAV